MPRISSRRTFFFKRVFPAIWFAVIVFFVAIWVRNGIQEDDAVFLLIPLLMALVGTILFKRLLWSLADEVQDGGDYLLIRYRGITDRIALSNVMNVSASVLVNPPRITLRLIQPGKFGSEVSFLPRMNFSLNPFAKSPIAEDLIVRAYEARDQRTT